jgi:hypothetical protein
MGDSSVRLYTAIIPAIVKIHEKGQPKLPFRLAKLLIQQA